MTVEKRGVLRDVDDAARRQARLLIRTASFASLGTLDAEDGSPAVSRISLATAIGGEPVFLISTLSSHTGNLRIDPRCSVLVGEPSRGDPLAHPRMTVIGTAVELTGPDRDPCRNRFLRRHPEAKLYVDFPDFSFWKLKVARASLNGGFGRAYALTAEDIIPAFESASDLAQTEERAVNHMNEDHRDAIDHYAKMVGGEGKGWRLATLDPEGLDLVRDDTVIRLWFDTPLASASELRPVLVELARSGHED
jgi:heme iron utilization protein